MRLLFWLLKRAFRRSIRSRVTGRWRNPGRPEEGRFTGADVDRIVKSAWQELDSLLPAARLERYPRQGTRLNAFLSVATLAVYRAVRRAGIEKGHAIGLVADAGWSVYHHMIRIPRFPARLLRRTPQGRIDFVIRAFLRFPFAPPADSGAAGYRVEAWKDEAGMHTHWTRCPPLEVFRELGGADELDAFRGTWCAFDYPAAEAMAAGGLFIRPHVLSRGDTVCDMTWTTVDNEVVQEVGRGAELNRPDLSEAPNS